MENESTQLVEGVVKYQSQITLQGQDWQQDGTLTCEMQFNEGAEVTTSAK